MPRNYEHPIAQLSPIRQLAAQTASEIVHNATINLTMDHSAAYDNELIDTESETLIVPVQHTFIDIYNNAQLKAQLVQLCTQYNIGTEQFNGATLSQYLAYVYQLCCTEQYTMITILQQMGIYNTTPAVAVERPSTSSYDNRPTSRHGKRSEILGNDYQQTQQQESHWSQDNNKLIHRRQLTPMPRGSSAHHISILPISYGIKFSPHKCIALCYDLVQNDEIVDRRVHQMQLDWLTDSMSATTAVLRLIQQNPHHLQPTHTKQLIKLVQKLQQGDV